MAVITRPAVQFSQPSPACATQDSDARLCQFHRGIQRRHARSPRDRQHQRRRRRDSMPILSRSKPVELCLDLAECADHIYTTRASSLVEPSGRAGLRLLRTSSGLALRVCANGSSSTRWPARLRMNPLSRPRLPSASSPAAQLHRYAGRSHRGATPGGISRLGSCPPRCS